MTKASASRTEGKEEAGRKKRTPVRFIFTPRQEARTVAVAGDFNHWDPSRHRMRFSPIGAWECEVELPPGRYQYKFVVNETEWTMDPHATASTANQYGSENSIIDVR